MQAMVSVGLVNGITRAVFVLFLARTLQVQPPPSARCSLLERSAVSDPDCS